LSQLAKPNPIITFTDNNGTSHTLANRDWEPNYAAINAKSRLEARFKTGDFLDKCKNIRYYLSKVDDQNPRKNGYHNGYKKSPWLVAECPDKNGNYLCTWLELGKCLVNLDGELYQGKK
jgi:ATP-binding cassette subfamily B (MDR/TAP) protein 1